MDLLHHLPLTASVLMAEASRGTEASHWVTQTVHCPAQHISVAGSESGHSPPSPAHPSSSHKCGTAAGTPWLHPPPSTHRPAAHKSVRSLCEPAALGSSHSHPGQLMTCHIKNFSLFYSNQLWGPSALSTFSSEHLQPQRSQLGQAAPLPACPLPSGFCTP